jgi:hypothetical protein
VISTLIHPILILLHLKHEGGHCGGRFWKGAATDKERNRDKLFHTENRFSNQFLLSKRDFLWFSRYVVLAYFLSFLDLLCLLFILTWFRCFRRNLSRTENRLNHACPMSVPTSQHRIVQVTSTKRSSEKKSLFSLLSLSHTHTSFSSPPSALCLSFQQRTVTD